jgi:CheY-like chemotaxis protein
MNQNIRILLADDDADDRLFFQEAVTDSVIHAKYSGVESGLQLIDFLSDVQASSVPDVIFLDINMPGMDGKECLREIRNQVQFADTPIIMLSTSTSAKDIDETYRDGANMYISKALFYMGNENWIEKLFPSDWRQGLLHPPREKFAFT